MKLPPHVIGEYLKWHKNWDDLCNQCGKCCYGHSFSSGTITTDYSDPCEFLDEETHLCRVFENRFKACKTCGKVTLVRALFSPLLPPTCAYVKTFRTVPNSERTSNN